MVKVNIPKIIWQTYKTHEVPSKWSSSPESLKRLHPDWIYHLTSDQDNRQFVSQEYPEYLNLYDRLGREIKPICQVDMVRYLLLHKYGGVYLDLDYKALKPLDPLFTSNVDLYLFRTPNMSGHGYTNSFMSSQPGCSFWIKCIQMIQYRLDHRPWYIFGDIRVIWTTGPKMLTDVLKQYNQPYVTIPSRLAHSCTICDHYLNRPCTTEDSYVEELKGSSWTNPTTNIFYFLVCRWREIFIVLFVLLLLLLVLLIYFKNKI